MTEAAPQQALTVDGASVRLRDFAPDDVDAALAIIGDDRVTTWLSFDSRDRDGAVRMVDAAIAASKHDPRTEYYLAVTTTENDDVIGFARLAFSGVQAAKLGYAINADHWGHGYARAAVEALTAFGFDELKLHRITAAIGPDNARSIKVVEALGFTYEGRLRDHVHTNGAWRDSLLFSLLRDEAPRADG